MPELPDSPGSLTPGAYLARRRAAAGLSIVDVAIRLGTDPRIAEHARARWIEQIEADAVPASFNTIVALRWAYPFDLEVLERLVGIALGAHLMPPQLCRVCACSEFDPCSGARDFTCSWVRPDLCSACIDPAAQVDAIHAVAAGGVTA